MFGVLFLCVILFLTGAATMFYFCAEKMKEADEKTGNLIIANEALNAEIKTLKKPSSDLRSVWTGGVSGISHIDEGSLIDIRVVKNDGTDVLYLAEVRVVQVTDSEMLLLLDENGIKLLTAAETALSDDELLRIYAVGYPG